jgi:hypothetical protein
MAITSNVLGSRFIRVAGTVYSLALNGSTDYATLPLTPSTGGFSLAMWIKVLPNTSDGAFLAGWNTGTTADGFQFKISMVAKDYVMAIYNGTNAQTVFISGNGTLLYNTWQHLAMTFDGAGNVTLYFNGQIVGSASGEVMSTTTNPFNIGNSGNASHPIAAHISNVTFQNTSTAWTQQQIVSLYRQNVIPSGAKEYTFNQTANDQTGANPATYTGTSYVADCPYFGARKVATGRKTAPAASPTSLYMPGNNASTNILPVNNSKLQIGATSSFTCGTYVYLLPKNTVNNNDNHCLFNCDLNFGASTGYAFYVTASTGGLSLVAGQNFYNSTTGIVPYNQWVYVMFTLSGSTLTGYVNGVSVWSTTITRVATGGLTTMWIGYEYSGQPAGRAIYGYLRDCFTTLTLLTQAQITAIVSSGTYPAVDIHYKLNEGMAEIATDSSGNSNHGTISAEPPVWVSSGRRVV